MTLVHNKVKRFTSRDTDIILVPCDRRKIKKLKRKKLLIKYGHVGPYWTSSSSCDTYHWIWKYFNPNVELSGGTVCFCKNFTNKEHKNKIRNHVNEYGMSLKQLSYSLFMYNTNSSPHSITNEAYLIFKNSKEMTKWKLTN